MVRMRTMELYSLGNGRQRPHSRWVSFFWLAILNDPHSHGHALNFSDTEDRVDPQTRKILDACPNVDSTELSELHTHLKG